MLAVGPVAVVGSDARFYETGLNERERETVALGRLLPQSRSAGATPFTVARSTVMVRRICIAVVCLSAVGVRTAFFSAGNL
jgi:hypothetical protein